MVTIAAEAEATIATLKLARKEISLSPGFEVCMLYEDSMDEKLVNMMRGMNFMTGLGLGKN